METSKAGSFLPDIDYSYPPVHVAKSPEPDIVVRSPTNSSSKRNSSSRGWRRDSALDDDHLRRGLKPRHISFIALGGVLGTGLFLG
ncbi:Aromatic amino acid transport protein AroP [Vanrija pseudolonga]|uniref:Aromatic amino acid transport protein AroP n=1 Tax=Vanrija pseudolonga TaxID=143232 RepID=A0AAF1BM30_9TREE|nr:Aromatic amino acid transport protein AroP [Vanrija pseudolonga]